MKLKLSNFIDYKQEDETLILCILHNITSISRIAECAYLVTTDEGEFYVPVFKDGDNCGKIAAIMSTEDDYNMRKRYYDASR